MKIDKKPSTILCYRPNEKVRPRSNIKVNKPEKTKDSTRSRNSRYKPSNRYAKNDDSRRLKNSEHKSDIDVAQFFATRKLDYPQKNVKEIYTHNDCIKNSKPAVDSKPSDSHIRCKRGRIQHQKNSFFFSPESMTESNFLHLVGPSPRSTLLRKRINYFTNSKENATKFCKMQSLKFNLKDIKFEQSRVNYQEDFTIKDKFFHIITNDRVNMKITPAHLKDPKLIIGFLKACLNIKN